MICWFRPCFFSCLAIFWCTSGARFQLQKWWRLRTLGYLAWGAALRFQPHKPPRSWAEFDAIHTLYWDIEFRLRKWPSRFPEIDPETMQWSWGLLATFYAAVLGAAWIRRLSERPVWVGLSGPSGRESGPDASSLFRFVPTATLILAVWFFCNWRHHITCPNARWWPDQTDPHPGRPLGAGSYGWICLVGLAGSLVVIVVLSTRRSRAPSVRPARYAARLVRLLPAALLALFAAWFGH